MKKEKADLEQLLNSLIEKGWKPFGRRPQWIKKAEQYVGTFNWVHWGLDYQKRATIRELVSKESWLWQFVCENRKQWYTMPQWWIKNPKICDEWIESVEKECNQNSYEYYIIESALKDESELEDFLLSNIKID